MAITDPSDSIQAFLTDLARQYLARAINGELVMRVTGFSAGRGGYDPLDPVKVLPIVGTETDLDDPVYPTPLTRDSNVQFEVPGTIGTLVVDCRLPATNLPSSADYGLGEVGVWATIIESQSNPLEIGTEFLFSLCHFPIRAKTNRDVFLFRVVTQF